MPYKTKEDAAAYIRAYRQTPTGKIKTNEANKRWRAKNREYHNAHCRAKYARLGLEVHRAYHLAKKYGLKPTDVSAMVEKQNGQCAICGKSEFLHVDHCHASGKVRVLLCKSCNMGLEMFKENTDALRKAAHYLEHHNGDG